MTRKEQIKEVAQKEMSKYPNFCITAPAFRMGAEWADHTMIDKACEWLKNDFEELTRLHLDNIVIDKFRKAMKGE